MTVPILAWLWELLDKLLPILEPWFSHLFGDDGSVSFSLETSGNNMSFKISWQSQKMAKLMDINGTLETLSS